MARYRSQYSSSSSLRSWQIRQAIVRWLILLGIAAIVVLVVFFATGWWRAVLKNDGNAVDKEEQEAMYQYRRLKRSEIPTINIYDMPLRDLLDDINDVQLEAAQRIGLPSIVNDPTSNPNLHRIATCNLYIVDSLSHSHPYLVPEASVLLNFICERFSQVLKEKHDDGHSYRPIVTSVLRTRDDVRRLLNSNPNASEQSCHCFGTTFDITYGRFLRDDGEEIQEYWLRDMLAIALYELRYEGLCYVRYEVKQPCFHITVRDVEYRGKKASYMEPVPLAILSNSAPNITHSPDMVDDDVISPPALVTEPPTVSKETPKPENPAPRKPEKSTSILEY